MGTLHFLDSIDTKQPIDQPSIMRVFILACLVDAAAAMAPLHLAKERIPGKYIVVLKPGAKLESAAFTLNTLRARVQRRFSAFNMMAVDMESETLEKVRALKDVLYVEEDGIMRVQQAQATWGLDRSDQRSLPFAGRAEVAYDAVGNIGVDCNGHGTHCSGTTSGATWGIAKNSKVYGVRVLGCLGSGSTAGVVEGMNFVATDGIRPAIASMSLGGGASSAMDQAVATMHNAGVTVSVAAGNSNANACNYSPARATEAITVGATDISDNRASFSNYGACVDIFAPGVDITSTWIGGNDATNTISGTSMACPHVSGAAALLVQATQSFTPDDVWAAMAADATPNVVGNPGFRSPNTFLYVN